MASEKISISEAQALIIEAKRLRPKRRFGQNFLVSPLILQQIVASLSLKPDDTVLEIGPGPGSLTQHLLAASGHVISVELDRVMAGYLRKKFEAELGQAQPKFTLIEQDFLRFTPQTSIAQGLLKPPFAVVGNIPYNITTPILFYLCGEISQLEHPWRQWVSHITLMIQKEVGERITAKPGTKAYNHLSIAVQMWFEARYVVNVPPNSFYPAPKVTSAVVQLTPRQAPLAAVDDMEVFARLIKAAFAQRRKTLRNSLLAKSFAHPDILDRMFALAQQALPESSKPISSGDRAEALSIEAFAALANAYCILNHPSS